YLYASDDNVRAGVGANYIITMTTPDCAALAEDAVATFAGVTVDLSVPDQSGFGPGRCVGPRTAQTPLPAGTFTGAPVALTIVDSTETWTIAAPGLYNGNITLASPIVAGQPATVAWTGGPPIFSAIAALDQTPLDAAVPTDPALQTNTVVVGIPAATPVGSARATIELDGDFRPGTSQCDGPASCDVNLVVSARLDVAVTGP
ncbi:MAG TPA: hypothetical protein VLB44_10350, partial [Kofleriaceae bacterium]|nr:hypothetical protein [Kofleriaceae bacterium]